MFTNQTAIITEASGGFGRETALRFGALGANVVVSDYEEAGLAETGKILEDEGIKYAALAGDISIEETSQKLVELALEKFGGLNIAINNAGIAQEQTRLHQTDSEEAKQVIDVDLMGVFYAMKHQLAAMMEDKNPDAQRNIVNVSSAAGVMGAPKLSIYSAAKHGVVGLTRSAATEYARTGIRINCICPAFTRTAMVMDNLLVPGIDPSEAEAKLVAAIPMRRLGEINEIVQAMTWICSPENGFYNGQTLSIDGGLTTF